MKKIVYLLSLLLLLTLSLPQTSYAQSYCSGVGYPCYVSGCGATLTLYMYDSYGDGWNGYFFGIYGGCPGGQGYSTSTFYYTTTLNSGSYGVQSFWVPCGNWYIQVIGGSYGSEVSWDLYGSNGNWLDGDSGAPYYSSGHAFNIGGGCIYGCIDPSATNYNSNAYIQNSATDCTYGPPPPVHGCTDPNANNYNPNATVDDGSCTYTPVNGCTDPNANNYNPNATVDDGSCTYTPVNGCTDPNANNYNPNANTDDGSCTYSGCPAVGDYFGGGVVFAIINNQILISSTQNLGSWAVDAYSGTPWGCDYVIGTSTTVGSGEQNTIDILNYSCTMSTNCSGTPNYNTTAAQLCGNLTEGGYQDWFLPSKDELQLMYNNKTTIDATSANYGGDVFISPGCDCAYWSSSEHPNGTSNNAYVIYFFDGTDANSTKCNNQYVRAIRSVSIVSGCTDPTADNYNPNAQCDDGSCVYTIYGCTDSLALNYNASANVDDGSCTYTPVYGCTDPNANNYNPNANTDDGSCCYAYGCTDPNATNYDPNACYGNNSCIYTGCTDPTACNFDPLATIDDGSCSGLLGCTDTTACNYNPLATCYNFSCSGISGCTDATACNYNSLATCDDGSCSGVAGCANPTACNYNPLATCDDGSCIGVAGCTDATACNYNSLVTCDDGSCAGVVGCTDATAPNYNLAATCDDGSCCFNNYITLVINNGSIANDNWFWLGSQDMSTTILVGFNYLTPNQDSVDVQSVCVIDSCLTLSLYSNSATGWNGGSIDVYQNGLFISTYTLSDTVGASISYVICSQSISGCTDPLADNYDPSATVDDGSCTYPTVCTSPSPTGAYVTELTHDRVRFNWDDMNSSTCMVEQYRIRYREVGTSVWSSKTMAGSGLCQFGLGTTSKMTLNLQSSTTYEYYMKAWYCGGSSSGWSALQNFTTEDDCQNIVNFTVSTPTTTKADFAWDTVSAYSFVRLQLRVDTTGASWFTAGGFGVFYPQLSKSKNGLVSGESYRAAARTWCNPNGGPYRSATWSTPIFWTQPTSVRIDGGAAIANLDVYPNPLRDVFNIIFTSESIQDLRVRILNVVGEVIISEDLDQFVGEYTKQINLHKNAKGIYFLEIETNDGVVNKKLILQ